MTGQNTSRDGMAEICGELTHVVGRVRSGQGGNKSPARTGAVIDSNRKGRQIGGGRSVENDRNQDERPPPPNPGSDRGLRSRSSQTKWRKEGRFERGPLKKGVGWASSGKRGSRSYSFQLGGAFRGTESNPWERNVARRRWGGGGGANETKEYAGWNHA